MATRDGVQPTRRSMRVEGDRVLEYEDAGNPDGPVVVFHHGTPGASFAPPPLVDSVTARGWRLLAPSRSGYAGSSRDEGRVVAAAAVDTAALCDGLGVSAFVTAGWSGGAPHSIACAAALPGRCRAAVSVAGVAPYEPGSFDWTAGMGEENIKEFELSLEAGPEYDERLAAYRTFLLELDPGSLSSLRDLFGDVVSDVDAAAAGPQVLRFVVENIQRGLAPGVGGWRDDDQAFLRGWGVDLAATCVPVAVWYGDQDHFAPPSHGEWLAAHVPTSRQRRFAGEGHVSLLLQGFDPLFDELATMAGPPW